MVCSVCSARHSLVFSGVRRTEAPDLKESVDSGQENSGVWPLHLSRPCSVCILCSTFWWEAGEVLRKKVT